MKFLIFGLIFYVLWNPQDCWGQNSGKQIGQQQVENVPQWIKSEKLKLKNLVQRSVKKLGNAADINVEFIEVTGNKTIDKLNSASKNLKSSFNKAKKWVTYVNKMIDVGSGLLSLKIDNITKEADTLKERTIQELKSTVNNQTEELDKIVDKAFENSRASIQSAVDMVLASARQMSDASHAVKEKSKNELNAQSDLIIAELYKNMNNSVKEVELALQKANNSFKVDVENLSKSAKTELEQKAKQVETDVKSHLESKEEELKNNLRNETDILKADLAEDLKKKIKELEAHNKILKSELELQKFEVEKKLDEVTGKNKFQEDLKKMKKDFIDGIGSELTASKKKYLDEIKDGVGSANGPTNAQPTSTDSKADGVTTPLRPPPSKEDEKNAESGSDKDDSVTDMKIE